MASPLRAPLHPTGTPVPGGCLQEGVFERLGAHRQFVQHDLVRSRDLSDHRRLYTVDFAAVRPARIPTEGGLGASCCEQVGQLDELRALHLHPARCVVRHEGVHGALLDQPAASDDEQVVGHQRHLGHQVTRHQHRASLAGEVLQEVANPPDAFGVEPVAGFIQDDRGWVADQCPGEAEALLHAERVAAQLLVGGVGHADEIEHLIDATARDAVRGCHPAQVVAAAARRVDEPGIEEQADLVERRSHSGVGLACVVPRSNRSRPTMQRIVVLLPAPLGPRKPVTLPGATSKPRSWRATEVPKHFVRFSTLITDASDHAGPRHERQLRPPTSAFSHGPVTGSGMTGVQEPRSLLTEQLDRLGCSAARLLGGSFRATGEAQTVHFRRRSLDTRSPSSSNLSRVSWHRSGTRGIGDRWRRRPRALPAISNHRVERLHSGAGWNRPRVVEAPEAFVAWGP